MPALRSAATNVLLRAAGNHYRTAGRLRAERAGPAAHRGRARAGAPGALLAAVLLTACIGPKPVGYVRADADPVRSFDRSGSVAVIPRVIGDTAEARACETIDTLLGEAGIATTVSDRFDYVLQVEHRTLEGDPNSTDADRRGQWRVYLLRMWAREPGREQLPMIWSGAVTGDAGDVATHERHLLQALIAHIGTSTDQAIVPVEADADH